MAKTGTSPAEIGSRTAAHALHLGERINTANFEGDALSSVPLAVRSGAAGMAVMFRYGVAVLINLTAAEETALLDRLSPRIEGRFARFEEETATIELSGSGEDQVPVGGPVQLRDMSTARLLVVSDVLAKSVALARDEREVARVFDVIDPFAKELAERGRTARRRTGLLKLIGNALLVQHRVSGRVAIAEKPDALWDRPDLERLYARLDDEYELRERLDALNAKIEVVAKTATTLADIIDTRRSLRLELIVVMLIAFEIAVTLYQLFVIGAH